MELADILAAEMKIRRWSQGQLSDRSGITQPQLSRILRRKNPNVTLDTLEALAGALGCAVVDLLPDRYKRRPASPPPTKAA